MLSTALEFPENYLLSNQAIPPGLDVRVPEHNEILRPTWVLKSPEQARPNDNALTIAGHFGCSLHPCRFCQGYQLGTGNPELFAEVEQAAAGYFFPAVGLDG